MDLMEETKPLLAKLLTPKIPQDEFDELTKKIVQLLEDGIKDPRNHVESETRINLMIYRVFCISRIDWANSTQIQSRFNRSVKKQLKKLGVDVTQLDEYLENNIKMYFPNLDI